MKNIDQNETICFKTSHVIKERLEQLAEHEGITGAGWMRDIINREWRKMKGEE